MAHAVGSLCEHGGAAVKCDVTEKEKVQCSVEDLGTGTYRLEWRSTLAGTYEAHILIDGVPITGSPTPLVVSAGPTELTMAEVSGTGLEKAVAGKQATFHVLCKDRFGNPVRPSVLARFEMAMLPQTDGFEPGKAASSSTAGIGGAGGGGRESAGAKSKMKERHAEWMARWLAAEPHPKQCVWHEQTLEIRYVPIGAGDLELHVWMQRGNTPTEVQSAAREPLPGSPFALRCLAGKAHAARSHVDGFVRLGADEQSNSGYGGRTGGPANSIGATSNKLRRGHRSSTEVDLEPDQVLAGEMLQVCPHIRDRLGNATAAPEGALKVWLETPSEDNAPSAETESRGAPQEMQPVIGLQGGLTTYAFNFEARRVGAYRMNLSLAGESIEGTPVCVQCIPGNPAVLQSRLVLPEEPELADFKVEGRSSNRDADAQSINLFVGSTYRVVVEAIDKCGNKLDRGGAAVTARITAIGGVAPAKNGDNNFEVSVGRSPEGQRGRFACGEFIASCAVLTLPSPTHRLCSASVCMSSCAHGSSCALG